MEALYAYINEARQYAQFPMSYKQFEELVLVAFEEYDDERAEELMYNIPQYLHGLLLGYIDGHYRPNHAEEDIAFMYNELQKIPINRLSRILGAGSEGSIIDFGDKVMKWFHKFNHVSSRESNIKIYKYFMEHPHKNFPKVYKVTNNYVLMEKLDIKSPKIKQYALPYSVMTTIRDHVQKNKPLNINIDKNILEWHIESCKYITQVLGPDHYPGDLISKNLGVRPRTNEVVWFDI